MQLRHLQSIPLHTPPNEGILKVTALCWAPNGKRLAVCTTERVVLMFDEEGNRTDKFQTKPADKGPKNYIIQQMVFSPQSDKLAIAQSDNMVFVYKFAADKKSICNKFHHSSPTTCIVWPSKRPNELVFGLAEGKVKVGQMKTHKPAILYQTESYVAAMCCNPGGNAIVSAHLDGSIYVFWFDSVERGAHVIAKHSSVPFALTWGSSIVVAGSDCIVTFYDEDGGEEVSFNYSKDPNCREFTVATTNPTGDAVVIGNYNSFYTYTRNKDTMGWEEKNITKIENMYSVTALDWKSDGSKLAVGTLCGIVDFYDVCLRRTMYKGGFELTYVSHSQVIVRQIETNTRIVIKSQYGCEILKTNIFQKRFVVANTTDTVLLGDLDTLKLSEVQWHGNGTEKYIFDNPSACVIYYAGEISIIEYGINECLSSVRTSNISSHVLSLRINERRARVDPDADPRFQPEDNKKIAFLLDALTICVKDLVNQSSQTIAHDTRIDWLELNGRANLLLFRDKRRILHLYNIETQSRSQLLNFCTYVQWVPNSDVVVAQNRNNLCVWYNINAPDQVTLQAIKGDVEDIERVDGRTLVIVDEGLTKAEYPLDEPLIEFGTAIDDRDFLRAMSILEELESSPEAEAMWKQLSSLAIAAGHYLIAQRCAAATGDVAMGRYLKQINALKTKAEDEMGLRGNEYYLVRSKMALLNKDLKGAEDELLHQGNVDECIEMYENLHKRDAAIRVAELTRHKNLGQMRRDYFQYLLDTNQEDQAAALKVHEGDYNEAINLYLKGGMPAKAADVVLTQNIQTSSVLDTVATALTRAGMFDRAGEFYELLEELPRALECYIRGHAYKPAVELARLKFPGRVVELEEKWGDHLVSQKQIDMAINHYIEAKAYQKAIEAALNARQQTRALQLLDSIGSDSFRPYYKQLARFYEDSSQFDLAEKCYIAADQPQLAVEMLTNQGRWERAHKLATGYLSEAEVATLYTNQAQKLEAEGRFKEAEKFYLTVKEKDLAINMYKKYKKFDDMIRLVQEHRPDLLKETHQFLAQTLETEGALREAEHHYVEAQEWHAAVNMYRVCSLWDDAIRVAKFYGGINGCKRVIIALLMGVGVAEGSKYLSKHGLIESAIEYATENGSFEMAFELATLHMPKKLPDIHLKHALFLEDDEHFREAEEEFVKAGKPREAIDMYVHQQDYSSAIRVAENYDPSAISDVYIAHAKVKSDAGDFKAAEVLYLNANRPDLALATYQESNMWQDALRIAQMHLPHRVAEISASFNSAQARSGKGGSKNDYLATGRSWEQSKNWAQAIDAYMAAQKNNIDSIIDLEELWDRAIEIARNYVPNRYVEIGLEVSRRLVELQREETAADILFDIGRHEEAINVCLDARKFEKAKSLAQGNPSLRRLVEETLQSHLIVNEDAKELVELGRTDAALDVLAKRGDWDHLWEVAAKEKLSSSVLGRYVLMRVEELLKYDKMAEESTRAQKSDEAVRTLQKRLGLISDTSIPIYRSLVQTVLSRSQEGEESTDHPVIIQMLRDIMMKHANAFRSQSPNKQLPVDIETLLMATHYQHMLYCCKAQGMKDLAAKCSVTLLKYPEVMNVDKAFYQAGVMCREAGNTNLAFMLLNRYVDLTEAIDTGDSSFMDNADYEDTDAIPLDGPLPHSHYLINEDAREEVRTWVLSVVTDSSIDQCFPKREKIRNTLYEGLYSSERPTCIVTGYPVFPADILEVNNSIANRKDWNAFVAKLRICPWTGQAQNPIY